MNDKIYIILTIILITILIILAIYNKLIKLKNNVKKAKANIEIYLNKRFELLPNLVECVKGYSKYEGNTLEEIVTLRNNYNSQKNISIKDAGKINNELSRYLAVVENYPELKANTQYLSLQSELSRIENELESSRRIYNDDVTRYNTIIETVPSNIVASIFAFRKTDLFQIEEHKKENIKINM